MAVIRHYMTIMGPPSWLDSSSSSPTKSWVPNRAVHQLCHSNGAKIGCISLKGFLIVILSIGKLDDWKSHCTKSSTSGVISKNVDRRTNRISKHRKEKKNTPLINSTTKRERLREKNVSITIGKLTNEIWTQESNFEEERGMKNGRGCAQLDMLLKWIVWSLSLFVWYKNVWKY